MKDNEYWEQNRYNVYWENLRHLEKQRNQFITFYVSFLAAILAALIANIGNLGDVSIKITFSLIVMLAIVGGIVIIQIEYQCKVYRDQLKEMGFDEGIFEKFKKHNILIKMCRIWVIASLFFIYSIFIMVQSLFNIDFRSMFILYLFSAFVFIIIVYIKQED